MKKMQNHMLKYGMIPGDRGLKQPKVMPGRGRAKSKKIGRGKLPSSPQEFPLQEFPQQQVNPFPSQILAQPQPVPINFDIRAYEIALPESKKSMLGAVLYPVVLMNSNSKIAGKITDMLLEMENEELLSLFNSPHELKLKVEEAIDALRRA
ncbi:unnamed protein product [Blepharisma stoltei]|uniref:PABC domain-containing protein n=1 Tax=Blepharisma stoltei TaxID=1481888 RepID=A0AAU9JC99_9CILI|nr:unnamed protein product [Blepharisma stoltei]